MKLKDLILILSPRITYDILDSQAEKSIKWDNINYDVNFYQKYNDREVDTIMPLDKDVIGYHMLIKLK